MSVTEVFKFLLLYLLTELSRMFGINVLLSSVFVELNSPILNAEQFLFLCLARTSSGWFRRGWTTGFISQEVFFPWYQAFEFLSFLYTSSVYLRYVWGWGLGDTFNVSH